MISELMPQVAQYARQIAFIRSLVGSAGAHDAFQCQSGFAAADLKAVGGRPAIGCVISKLLGKPTDTTPAFVDMMQGRPLVRDSARSGFLGPSYAPFRPDMSKLFTRQLEPGNGQGVGGSWSESCLGTRADRMIEFAANG